jgi:2-polyprenyl-6-methoxyphenol hydroxylase-like FAD-dependent oxidoreductase
MMADAPNELSTEPEVDVVVVGGGLAGCVAATMLHTLGATVAVIDRVREPRPEFRAEQVVGPQLERLRDLGCLGHAASGRDATLTTTNARNGRILDRTDVDQIGMPYRDMVANARAVLPPGALIIGRVVAIDTSPTLQIVRLGDGTAISARLVILATGLVLQLRESLGIGTEIVSKAHSLCIGFDMTLMNPMRPSHVPLIYYGERIETRVDYLALFQVGDTLRANLFCYHSRTDEWPRAFIEAPDAILDAALPRLRALIGDFTLSGPIEMRENDIRVATDVARDGILAIGDAFQTPCPSAGTGIDRILSDVDALLRHYPTWTRDSSVAATAIAAYYEDPIKRVFDAECIRIARYRKAVSTELGLRWRLHRTRVFLQRRLKGLARDRVTIAVWRRATARFDVVAGLADETSNSSVTP